MATITEDYVSFETAKLLKEKGFDEGCHSFYDYAQRLQYIDTVIYDSELSEEDNECVAPTLQMTMKWLRESHNLYIEPYVIKNYNNKKLEYTYSIQDLDFNGSDDGIECCKNWNSPEEASEAAIKYCLENLIK